MPRKHQPASPPWKHSHYTTAMFPCQEEVVMDNAFTQNFLVKLSGKISDDDLKTVAQELLMYVEKYDIKEQTTELAVDTGEYQEFKIFMVTKKIEGRSGETLNLYRFVLSDMLLLRPLL